MIANVDVVVTVTKVCVALRTFLMKTSNANSNRYCPENYIDTDGPSGERIGDWRGEENSSFALQPLNNAGSNNYSRDPKKNKKKNEKILPTISFPERVHWTGNYNTNNLKNISDVF